MRGGGGILLDQLRRRAPGALRGQVAVRADRARGRGSVLLFGIPRLAFPLLPRPRGPYVFDSGAVGLVRRIAREGGKELALELEEKGYDWIRSAAA